jgi:hypothetical protein
MPVTKQKYNLSGRHQLIDLNQEFINFKLDFQVVSVEPDTHFHAVVMEQEQLDSKLDLKNLDMKIAKGKIGGNIVADKNVYNNYFLVLKAVDDKPVEVELEINIEEIPPAPTPAPTSVVENFQPSESPQPKPVPFYRTSWFALLIVGVILGGLLYYYLFYIKKPIAVTTNDATMPIENHPVAPSEVPAPSKKSPVITKTDNDLYSKLRAIS